MSICGRNTITEPTPPITPSTSMSFIGPSIMRSEMTEPIQSTPDSIHPIGYCPNEKVASNITHSISMKIGNPTYLLVMMLSMRCVT